MNYIKQLNTFYKLLPSNSLSSNAQSLYLFLLNYNNGLCWKKEFTVANTLICCYTKYNRQVLDRARNELMQKGYIEYKKGTSNQAGQYLIIELNLDDTQNGLIVNFDTQGNTQGNTHPNTQGNTQGDTQAGHTVIPLNKLNKTKLNKTKTVVVSNDKKPTAEFVKFWNENIGLITPYQFEILSSYVDDGIEEPLVLEAIKEAVASNAKNVRYVQKILDRCLKDNVRTVADFKANKVEFSNKSEPQKKYTVIE